MWRDDAYLLDILIAAKRAKEFAADLTWEEFQKSSLHQHAIMKTLEIIGEAANKISQNVKDAHPEIPWKEIVGMRNRLIHEYFSLDIEKIWDTVQNDIPLLIVLIEPLVPPEEES
jgi:uncharacterized protein with HEPN domain